VSTSQYQAGVCNIGGPEVKRRKQVFQLGSLLFTVISLYLIITGAAPSAAAITFFPAMLAAVGFVQSRKKFCFAFGLMGTFNFAEAGTMSKVASKAEISADRRAALKIIAQSLGLALVATAIVAVLLAL
jgi:hypothetical protein